MNRWKAACWVLSSTSPVVDMNTTAANRLSDWSEKAVASSVASTAKPCVVPSACTAATPSGIEAWRKPLVREKTSTRLPAGAGGRAHAAFEAGVPTVAAVAGATVVSVLREELVEQAAVESRTTPAASARAVVWRRGMHMGREWLTMDERHDRAGTRRRKMSRRRALSQCERAGPHSILTVTGAVSSFPRTFFKRTNSPWHLNALP